MGKFLIKRILTGVLTLFIILTMVFVLMRLVGGNPVYSMLDASDLTPENIERLTKEYGFDKPIVVQYGSYLLDILHGDWGTSYFNYKGVFENMVDRWEPTLLLTLITLVIMVFIGIPLGILGATHRNSALDYGTTILTLFMQTIPAFWLGLIAMWLFAFKLKWFPLSGYTKISEGGFWNAVHCLVLPASCLAVSYVGSIARQTRNSFLGVLKEDYIRTAKAKGLPRGKILYKHGLKNAVSLITTMISNNVAGLLGGSIVIEKIFGIEGIGKLCLDSLNRRDYSQQQACVLACAAIFVVMNILQDFVYKWIDPRIDFTN